MSEKFANQRVATTLNGAILAAASTLVVSDASGLPSSGVFRIILGQGANAEIVQVGAISGSALTGLIRGSEGTTARDWPNNSAVAHILTAASIEAGITDKVSDHETDTTAIHGIADTSVLETVSGSQAKVDTHNADTTGVHGISDTAVLETSTGAQTKVDTGVSVAEAYTDTHVNDTSAAHVASSVGFTPTGSISSTDVQAAVAEVASEGLALGTTPSTQAFGDSAAGGSAGTASKNDHKHGIPALGSTPSTQAFGDAASGGSGTTPSKNDHKHGMPSERAASSTTPAAVGTAAVGTGTTDAKSDHVHATGAGTPSTQAFSDAASTGSGPAAAMTDHKHGMPAAPAGSSGGTPALVYSTSNAAGAATTFLRTNDQLALFDATVPVTQAFSDAAATGSVALAARRDHKHGMMADPVPTHLAADTGTAGKLHIRVSEPAPIQHVSLTGDDTFDGRWDRPKLTPQAAHDALSSGGEILIAGGTYTVNGFNVTNNNLHIRGVGMGTSILKCTTGDLFNLGTVGANLNRLKLSDIQLESLGGTGGDIFVPQNGADNVHGVVLSEFERVRILQNNAAKYIWHTDGGIYVDNHWTDFEMQHVASATVPAFYLHGSTSAIVVSHNTWNRGRVTYSGNYFFWLEHATSTYVYDNFFRDINAEVCDGGVIKILSGYGNVIENVTAWDNTTTTKDLLVIGATGALSRDNIIRNFGRRSGSLGSGLVDIKLIGSQAPRTTIDQAEIPTLTGFKIDLGSNASVRLNVASDVTITNENIASTTKTYFDKATISTGRSATASLPSASTVGAGAQHYDTTLGQPVWSTGSAWQTATGSPTAQAPMLVKAGAVSDSDFTTPMSGQFGLDTTNHRFYIRDGSTWRYVEVN